MPIDYKLLRLTLVKFFRNGEVVEDYDGDRTTEDLIRFVKRYETKKKL